MQPRISEEKFSEYKFLMGLGGKRGQRIEEKKGAISRGKKQGGPMEPPAPREDEQSDTGLDTECGGRQ